MVKNLTKQSSLYITEGIIPKKIKTNPRVGIKNGIDKLWNFKIRDLIFIIFIYYSGSMEPFYQEFFPNQDEVIRITITVSITPKTIIPMIDGTSIFNIFKQWIKNR